jgi:VWFA-related protein
VDLVLVDAVVRDAAGAPAKDLQREDFVVLDDGTPQTLTHFSRDLLPIAVALVVDRSPSIEPFLGRLRKAALEALRRLKPDDKAALFSFDVCPSRRTELTADREKVSQAIEDLRVGVGTDVFGALRDAARFLRDNAPHARRAIILISDNYSNVGEIKERDALREILTAGAVLYGIRTPESAAATGAGRYVPSIVGSGFSDPSAVQRLAGASGGGVFDLHGARELGRALEAAISNLRLGCTLGFAPSDLGVPGSYHRLSVRLKPGARCADCRVEARAGYFSAQRPPAATETPDPHSASCEERLAREHLRSPYALLPSAHTLSFKVEASDDALETRLHLTIDATKVSFRRTGAGLTAELIAAAFLIDEAGNKIGEHWQKEAIRFSARRAGIRMSMRVPRPLSNQTFRIFVYDLDSRRLGMRLIKTRKLKTKTPRIARIRN